MVGYIYKCECVVTKKVYIGQTLQNYYYRGNDHKYNAFWKDNPLYDCKFYRAIRKYGLGSFVGTILQTIDKQNRNELEKVLNEYEIYFIKQYDSFRNGYNSTKGGDSSYRIPKKVIVLSDSGKQINMFNSALEAAEFYHIKQQTVGNICSRFSRYTIYDNQRIVFRGENDSLTESELKSLQVCHHGYPIEQYNLNGILIKSFPNLNCAAKELGLKNNRISTCCRRKSAFVLINGARYIFRYRGDIVTKEDLSKAQIIKSDPKVAVVAIDSETNQMIGGYVSQSEASKVLGVKKCNISEALNGKRKTAGKYNNHPIKGIKSDGYETI